MYAREKGTGEKLENRTNKKNGQYTEVLPENKKIEFKNAWVCMLLYISKKYRGPLEFKMIYKR